MIYLAMRNEKYYLRKIITIQKNCWKQNMNKVESAKYIIKYLEKRRFNLKKHSFIIIFKKELENAYIKKSEKELSEAYKKLYIYERKVTTLTKI